MLVGVALANVLGAAGLVGTGWGIANEKKWGWYLGLVMSAIELVSFAWLVQQSGLDFNLMLGSLFAVMHAVLILHTDSRAYVRIWFK